MQHLIRTSVWRLGGVFSRRLELAFVGPTQLVSIIELDYLLRLTRKLLEFTYPDVLAPSNTDYRVKLLLIGISGVPEDVTEKIVRQDDQDHRQQGEDELGLGGHRVDVLRLV